MNRVLFFLLCIINSLYLNAQSRDFHFKYLSTADGLSNNSVIAIEQDKLGQIWLGTRNGLNKYNGDEFVVYRNNPKDTTSISNSDILTILEDTSGDIWVGTYKGLNRYDPKKNTFKTYYQLEGDENSLGNAVVICAQEMPNGELWFGTANGISIYNKEADNFINVFNAFAREGIQNFRNIQRIFLDSNNEVWVGTTKGLAKLESRLNSNFVFKEFESGIGNSSLFIQDIIEIEPGILGLATQHNGFVIFDTSTEEFNNTRYPEIPNNMDVRVLQKDDEDNLWLGTKNGVIIISPSRQVQHLKESKDSSSGISQNYIKSIFKDQNGSIWLGTYSGGANIWSETNENFVHFKNNNVFNNVVNAIVTDKASRVYFGTEGGIINKVDKNGTISEIIRVPDDETILSYPVQTMLYTEPDLLWVGVLNHGIYVYDLKTNKEATGVVSPALKTYLKNTGVFAIKEGVGGDFWFGTFGKGIVKYNVENKHITAISKPDISTNIIKALQLDDNGTIWAGGLGAINALRPDDAGGYDVTRYLTSNAFLSFNIKTIYKDSSDNIWVGTNAKGFYKFDGTDFKRVPISEESPISTVNTVLEDERGVLWLSTDKGIVKYNPKYGESVVYEETGIFSNNEFSPNSGLRLNSNQFYFGGNQGVTTFNSKKIIKNEYSPNVLLSDFKLMNQSVQVDGDSDILSNSIIYTKSIELNYDNSNFSISYALPNYINSKANSYAYRLKGLDDTWTFTNNTEAFFTLQNAGTYNFEVKGSNNDGLWNDSPTSLRIVVNPPPWKTWWAYMVYLILIGAILYVTYWMLQSKARLRHRLELEYIENKRNEELNKAKLQFFTNISHEFRTPLTLILGPLQQALQDYSGSNALFKKLKIIEGSANHLLRLINRLMDFRKLKNDQFELETAEGNVVKFLKEIFLSFSEYAKVGGYNYTFTTTENKIDVFYDRYKLERVFYNLISNAFRYTQHGGSIAVSIEKGENDIFIKVSDSGVGIAEEYLDKIFERFYEVPIHNKPDKNYNKGTGIGLSIASDIVKLHHGTIAVENAKPHGAVFTVKLKLGKSHLSENEILKNFKTSDDVSQYASQIDIPKMEISKDDIDDILHEEKKYTILIAEDNQILRSFMKEMLKRSYNVLQAENGKEALKMAIKHTPDLIISDVIMPQMVGTELCAKIKTNLKTSHIPVILLTSRTSLVYKFEGLESGADDYISKPFNIIEFKLKVKNLLDSKQRIKEKFSSNENYAVLDVSLTSIDEELLKKAFEIVEVNLSNEDFNIDLFSRELGVSRSMLFTKIKAWTNRTPKDFILEIRLKRASKLLELGKLNISEVAYKVGFKRPKYFGQCFQKKYGLTPSEYSKKFIDYN